MTDLTRRAFMKIGSVAGAVLAGKAVGSRLGVQKAYAADGGGGFQAANGGMPGLAYAPTERASPACMS